MKKDWTYKKLGEVCDILNGYAFKSNKYVGEGIRVIRIANVQKGIIVDDQPAFYPLSTQFEIDKYILNEGDILMSLTGNVGRVGILQKEMLPAALNQRVACLRMIDNSLYSKFFFHYLNSDLFEQKCIASARGIAQLNMSTEWLKEQFIPIPPLSIQRSIVAELDLLHSVISKKKEQLRELDNLAQSLFYQMFGDPITNPMGWEQRKIGLFAQLVAGATPSTAVDAYWENGSIPWLSSGEVSKGRIYETDNKITQTGYDNCSTKLIPPHTLIMALAGQGKTRGTVGIAEIALCTNQSICSFLTDNTINVDYMYYLLKYEYDYLRGFSNGDGGRGGLNLRILRNLSIITPPLSLQQSFAAKVSAIEAQKQAITQSIQHTEALLAQRMDHYFG
jgi:type I restriction enzyme S subunit